MNMNMNLDLWFDKKQSKTDMEGKRTGQCHGINVECALFMVYICYNPVKDVTIKINTALAANNCTWESLAYVLNP